MSYKVWHSPLKSTTLKTLREVQIYYQVQYATVGRYPCGYDKIAEKKK